MTSPDAPPSYYNVTGEADKQQASADANMDGSKNPYGGTVYNQVPSVPLPQQGIYNVQPGGVYMVVGPQQPSLAAQHPMILRPDDYLCWSIFTVLCCNPCCLGWVALYYSIKSRSAADMLNMDVAVNYSTKAKSWNQKLLAVGIVLTILSIIFEIFKYAA